MGRPGSRSVINMWWAKLSKKTKGRLVAASFLFLCTGLVVAARTIPIATKRGYVYSKNYDNCAEHASQFRYSLLFGPLPEVPGINNYRTDKWVPAPPKPDIRPTTSGLSYDPCGGGYLYITKRLYLL
jgi:hypothetical protein